MPKFTRYNNPNKRKKRVNKSYTDICTDVLTEMLIDQSLGYEIPVEYYVNKASRIAGKKQ